MSPFGKTATPTLNSDDRLPLGLKHGALWSFACSLTEKSIRDDEQIRAGSRAHPLGKPPLPRSGPG